jgi:preprotein translocase subunit SecF
MKRVITFSKYYLLTALFSLFVVIVGLAGFFSMGINLGIDFQAGLNQEVQLAPTAMRLTYNGPANASVNLSRSSIDIVISGVLVEEVTHSFPYNSYPTQAELARGLRGIQGLAVMELAPPSTSTLWFLQSAQSSSLLHAENPFVVHYLSPDASPVRIEDVRASLLSLGNVSVQVLGAPAERRFMIRLEDSDLGIGTGSPAERVVSSLENSFGQGEVVVVSSDYVGSRFSKNLSNQAAWLFAMTLLLILAYCSFRFKLQYGTGAILAIFHDGLIMLTFIVWSRMEFNTVTIAALMTTLGYSINDKVVIFDRMKETRRIFPDDSFVNILNRAITETLNRTIITTVTTMMAVSSLYIFTTGAMKDFALASLVGLLSSVYSTIFIASNFVLFWENKAQKRAKKKQDLAPARA